MTLKKTVQRTEDGPSFERSLERLEKIVAEMEAGTLGLEDMISRFEEGQKLIRFCSQKLNEVERKIEVLVKKGDKLATEPFEPEEDGEEAEEGKGKESGGKSQGKDSELF